MSGETECDGINYDGRDEIKAAISVLRRFDNRHGHDFDGGDKSVCKAITKIETELVDLGRRATPPGYETVPEGASDYKALYHELVYQVGIKHPDETRHQTALRYLTNAENQQNNTPQQAKEPPNAQGL